LKTELFKLQELGEITEAEFQKLKDIQESLQPDALGTLHWDLELEEINARSQLSVEILDSSSLMESSAIPVEVLCKATCQDNQDDEFRQGLNLLQEFSLINWNKDEGNCSMHSLVQESVVKRYDTPTTNLWGNTTKRPQQESRGFKPTFALSVWPYPRCTVYQIR
jgi:hypothetical protein